MDALRIYGSDSESSSSSIADSPKRKASDSESSSSSSSTSDSPKRKKPKPSMMTVEASSSSSSSLPPPPSDLLSASNSSCLLQMNDPHRGRIRSFPHVDGNYALHVYIPVLLSSITKARLEPFMKEAFSIAPELQLVESDTPSFSRQDGRSPSSLSLAKEYHISLSRTVPILIHQIDSIVSMLQNKFDCQKGYWLELDYWEIFVNDDQTRAFLSSEVIDKGLVQICKQISLVNEVFKLHNLQTFYEDPRPHASILWTLGDLSPSLIEIREKLNKLNSSSKAKPIWSHFVNKIECKIGNRVYYIWKEKPHGKIRHVV